MIVRDSINKKIRKLTLNHKLKLNIYDVISPNDGKEIASVEIPNEELIEKIIQETSDSFKIISKKENHVISEILNKVADKIKENLEYLSLLIATEGGKPIKDARVEVARSENTIRECAIESLNKTGELIDMQRSNRGKNKIAYTKLQPIGLVLAISAFNHPLNLLCHQVGTAIAAKCPVILKPATNTALSSFELYKYFIESGLEESIFQILPIEGEDTAKIVGDKRFKYVSFIGSEKVGWQIWKNIYPGTKIQLEHGGTAPAIVCEDADLDKAVNSLIISSFYHSGQVCVSTQNIFIHEDKYNKFKDLFIKKAINLKVGDARNNDTDCGPIIKKDAIERIHAEVRKAKSQGANILIGGNIIKDLYYEVTVIENVSYEMDIYKSEIFGPVVNLFSYNNLDDIIHQLNKSEYGFQTCIFTKDLSRANYFIDNIEHKAVIVNENNAFRVDWMPFGGYKRSGYGVGGVKYAINDMSLEKLVIIDKS